MSLSIECQYGILCPSLRPSYAVESYLNTPNDEKKSLGTFVTPSYSSCIVMFIPLQNNRYFTIICTITSVCHIQKKTFDGFFTKKRLIFFK